MRGPDGIRLDTPRGRHHRVEGHHDFLMDERVPIAETIRAFILEQEAAALHGEPR